MMVVEITDPNCLGCGLRVTPTTIDANAVEVGVVIHDALSCLSMADRKLAVVGGITSPHTAVLR